MNGRVREAFYYKKWEDNILSGKKNMFLEKVKKKIIVLYKDIIGKPLSVWQKRDFSRSYNEITTLDIELTGKCNLNCKGCSHFSPIAENEMLQLNEFESDLKQLAKIMRDKIQRINLLGGEPLLHEQLEEFMKVSHKYFPKTEICIVSNGILLLKQKESFWITAHKCKIGIEVTRYPINLDFKKMKKIAKKYDVAFKFYGRSRYIQKTQYFLPFDFEGRQNEKESFAGCLMARKCVTLCHGRLFPCSYAAYVDRFNIYFDKKIPLTENDYADIYQEDTENIMKKISNPIPMCRYCNVKARTYGNRWEVSKREITEWC